MKKISIKSGLQATLKSFGIKAVRVPRTRAPDVIFIAIPKTGSQSVRDALRRQGMVEYSETSFGHFQGQARGMVSFGHLDLKALRKTGIVDEVFFERAFKFAFVRNPYDRVHSAYSYLRRLGSSANATNIQHRVHRYRDFREFVLNEIEGRPFTGPGLYKVRENSLLAPQVRWLTDMSDALLIDFVGRFEHLAEDWKEVTSQAGLLDTQLPKLNISNRSGDYKRAYTPDLVDIVSNAYSEDFRAFDYSFE